MYNLFSFHRFSESDFNEAFTASELIKLFIGSGISVPNGNDDYDRLNKLLVTNGLFNHFKNLHLSSWAMELLKNEAQLDVDELMELNREILSAAYPQRVPTIKKDISLFRLTGSFWALINLFVLSESDSLGFISNDLKEDIQKAIKAILAIEDLEKERKMYYKKKHIYKEFPQEHIRALQILLEKSPVRVGVNFERDSYFTNKEKPAHELLKMGWKRIHRENGKNTEEKNLPDLRFCLKDDRSGSLQNEEGIRNVLTYGLFYYTDQLMHGRFLRPRKCTYKECKGWFLAKKRNHWHCSPKCKDAEYGASPEGSKKNKRASWLYRHRKEYRIIAKSNLTKFFSIKDSILDPNNKKGAWEEVLITKEKYPIAGVCLKQSFNLKKSDVRRIAKKDFDPIWALLQQAKGGLRHP